MTERKTNQALGKRIRVIRKARRLTLAQLEEATGIDRNTIGHIERCGRTYLSTKRLEIIAAGLGVTVEQIESPRWRTLCERDGIGLREAK